ncbi:MULTISPECIES: SDR family oxidoreductase [Arthrobacter]|uniref:SDR family oxidoreductase n=1 Tax=Arthrobacter oryzae TaxID=409290 RepID=A0A3N0C9G0_9MICC|nr:MULTISPECIES: SDR family oxidoreductase [Arthrobacter]RNL60108.1 SDR family oxidoreductase [Arthrobacter oryzae]
MEGKTAVVTGATGGIGRATAHSLALMGAHVVITGRNPKRTKEASEAIRKAGGGKVDAFVADLSSQAQVRQLADELLTLPHIDVLINNAGGYWNTRHTTVDGIEHTLALNHLAPFLLTNLLLERLQLNGSARVVTVSSNAQAMGNIDFNDLQGEQSYSGARAYNQSKLANLLFTYELARRLEGTSVTANALHPGMVSTGFGAEDPGRAQRLLVPLLRPFMLTADQGAATPVHLASAPDLTDVNGRFFARRKPRRSSSASYDQATAAQLWKVSAKMTGLAPTG